MQQTGTCGPWCPVPELHHCQCSWLTLAKLQVDCSTGPRLHVAHGGPVSRGRGAVSATDLKVDVERHGGLNIWPFCVCVSVCLCVSVCVSVRLCASACLTCVCLLFICLSSCFFVHQSVCLMYSFLSLLVVHLICRSISLSAYCSTFYLYLYVCLSLYLFVPLTSNHSRKS